MQSYMKNQYLLLIDYVDIIVDFMQDSSLSVERHSIASSMDLKTDENIEVQELRDHDQPEMMKTSKISVKTNLKSIICVLAIVIAMAILLFFLHNENSLLKQENAKLYQDLFDKKEPALPEEKSKISEEKPALPEEQPKISEEKPALPEEQPKISEEKYQESIQKPLELNQIENPLGSSPKILWLFTDYRLENQKMLEQLLGNFILLKAKESELEIRLVTSWSAYDWLSDETLAKITKTMQNTKFQQDVDDLLRLALLIEHGGIIMKLSQTFYIDKDFNWIKEYFKFDLKEKKIVSEVLLFSEQLFSSQQPQYQDFFIAAAKGAALLRQSFDILSQTIMTGNLQFERLKKAQRINKQVNSTYVMDITRNIIQSLIETKGLSYYNTSVVDTDVSKFQSSQCRNSLVLLLKQSESEYKAKCGEPKHIIHISYADRQKFEDQLENQLTNEVLGADQNGFWYTWMMTPQNRKLFEPSPPREISYCLLDAHPDSDLSLLKNSFQRLKSQTFKRWTAVYYVEKENNEMLTYIEEQMKQGYNIKLGVHTGSVGRNYQVGIINLCPNKSFVVVLKRKESFSGPSDLEVLSLAIAPRPVLGAFIRVNVSGQVFKTQNSYQQYSKYAHNGKNPALNLINEVINHLRVFHSDCYKLIPQFQLRTAKGEYSDDRFSFLEQFLYMMKNMTQIHDVTEIPHTQRVKWYIKSNQHIFDVPNRIVHHPEMVINIQHYEEVSRRELQRNYFKIEPFSMTINMDHLVQNGIPMNEFAVFNPGMEYQPYTVRNKPPLIPKIIHNIWIGGKVPTFKQKIIQANMELYPDFEFKLWGKDNITQENFPLSHDLLQNLYNMENISRYSKRATMADIMRHEVTYHHGGFYMDISMMLFDNVFNKWLSYKLALATERTYRHRWSQSMCIFGVIPKFPGLHLQVSPNNTNNYNIWNKDALEIAGPNDFRWTVRGMEQYDPDYLILEYDAFYPMAYDLPNFWETFCFTFPSTFKSDHEVVQQYGGRVMIKNCGAYYPYSFGREFTAVGGSWMYPKW